MKNETYEIQVKLETNELKEKIIKSLEGQGFIVDNDSIFLPDCSDKEDIRRMHGQAVTSKIQRSAKGLKRYENHLIKRLAFGNEVVPKRISPYLKQVLPDSEDELLFRYVSLHWSIPVSSGYGRRLRFLVLDRHTDKLMGIFGLGDPVFDLAARDKWVGWNREDRRNRLHHVMDAFVLGAVPPYSFLLSGKLVAMLVASNEVREAFRAKYANRYSKISGKQQDGRLAMISTTSALGRSSIYNRLKFNGRLLYHSVGFTAGSGDFHFSNGIYRDIIEFALKHCKPTAKKAQWGNGFRNRREVVRKVLSTLGLSSKLVYHQIRREIFLIPLAVNSCEFLRGEDTDLHFYDQSVDALFDWFRKRWLLPRAEWDKRFREFNPESYRLW